ncbi:hypothetical protein Efla_005790 [Eimeria flavescens]
MGIRRHSSLLFFITGALHLQGSICIGSPEGSKPNHPVVAVLSAGRKQPVTVPRKAEAERGERVYLNADGSVTFDCPKAVCESAFFFGRGNYGEAGGRQSAGIAAAEGGPGAEASGSEQEAQAVRVARSSSEDSNSADRRSSDTLRLKDITTVTDMTWLGVDEKAHKLAFLKNSMCGGLFVSVSQLPPARPDLACAIANLDAHSIYLKRLQASRFQIAKGLELAIRMGGALALDSREREWRRSLTRSTTLRFLIFFAQTFGGLKPNIVKTNPGTVINQILLKHKHLFYPLTDLCLYVKACETIQPYPERLLQGHPNHVHPDDASFLEPPIYAHMRQAGAEVTFPREAPTIFQPRIYDGNVPIDRRPAASKKEILGIFKDMLDLITDILRKGSKRGEDNSPASEGEEASLLGGSLQAEDGKVDLLLSKIAEGAALLKPPSPASVEGHVEAWKKQVYRTWHNLWVLNLVIYQASDMWAWVQNHEVASFAFRPWKVKHIGLLRTTEAAPMRWRNLSPRFSVEPFASSAAERGPQLFASQADIARTPSTTPSGSPDWSVAAGAHAGGFSLSTEDSFVPGEQADEGTDSPAASPSPRTPDTPEANEGSRSDAFAAATAGGPSLQGTSDKPSSLAEETPRQKQKSGGRREASLASASSAKGASDEADVLLLPEGCSPLLTDMTFFKKLGLPDGRLRFQGPEESGEGSGVQQAAAWKPTVVGAEVRCPPKVHPDNCGLTASFYRPYSSPWIWILERDGEPPPDDGEAEHADVVWIFRGTFVSKLWLVNGMGVAVPYRPLSRRGRFHYGIVYLFDQAVRPLIEQQLKLLKTRLAGRKRPLVMVFSGHSLGAAIAELSAWYFAKRAKSLLAKGKLVIRGVTFGSPSWGDSRAYEDMQATGVKIQELNMDIDPVGVLFGEEGLTGLMNKKPFQMRIHIEDMDRVEVASSVAGAPPFSGRVWTRASYRPTGLLKRLAAMMFDLEDVDMVLLDPVIAHFTAYTAALTIMAGLLDEASFGSGVAAPFIANNTHIVGQPQLVGLKAAHQMLQAALRRVEADRLAEEERRP